MSRLGPGLDHDVNGFIDTSRWTLWPNRIQYGSQVMDVLLVAVNLRGLIQQREAIVHQHRTLVGDQLPTGFLACINDNIVEAHTEMRQALLMRRG